MCEELWNDENKDFSEFILSSKILASYPVQICTSIQILNEKRKKRKKKKREMERKGNIKSLLISSSKACVCKREKQETEGWFPKRSAIMKK
jgi:hypothetical protein